MRVRYVAGDELRQHRSEDLGRHDVVLARQDTESPFEQRVLAVDRPFLFVIHDVQTAAPLFLGRIDDPSVT